MSAGGSSRARLALVTGATGGLGRPTCLALADAGCDVVIHYLADDGAAETLKTQVEKRGRRAFLVRADLAADTPDGVAGVLDECDRVAGAPDVAVLAASSQEVTPWAELNIAVWDRLYAQTLRHTAALVHALGARMVGSRDQAIVLVGSIEAYRPAADHAPYAVFKAATHHLVLSAAQELGSAGIRVVGVAPGLIDRPGLAADWPDGHARWCASAALGRPVQAAEIASLIAFVASPAASAITGVTIPVDCGWSSSPGW